MRFVEAIVLGVIQGLTEFLPISSSGHLEIGKAIFGNEIMGQESLFMTLVLHFGTALSTIVVFKKEIYEIIKGISYFKKNEHTQFSIKIIISMIPATIVSRTNRNFIYKKYGSCGSYAFIDCCNSFYFGSYQRYEKKNILF